MKTTSAWAILLLLITSGCGFARGEHRMLPTSGLIEPKHVESVSDVKLFRGQARPKTGCVPTAMIVANGNGYATMDDLEKTLRKEAKDLQSDVVFVGEAGRTSSQVETYGGGMAMSDTIYWPHLTGVACRTGSVWHGLRVDQEKGRFTVRYVFPDSPGEKAGIHEGDDIVTVNGLYMGDDSDVWHREVNAKPPSTAVDVQVVRAGSKQTLRMVLEAPR